MQPLRELPGILGTADGGSSEADTLTDPPSDRNDTRLHDVGPATMITDSVPKINFSRTTSGNKGLGAQIVLDGTQPKVISRNDDSLNSKRSKDENTHLSLKYHSTKANFKDDKSIESGSANQLSKGDAKSRSTFHGSHTSLMPDNKERLFWGLAITFKHMLFASLAAVITAGCASLPMAPYYEEGRKLEAGGLFVAMCWFVAPTLSVTCVIWMRSMNEVPTHWISLEAWLPGLVYSIQCCTVYVTLILFGLWPLPMLPFVGATTFVGCVFTTVYLQLPKEVKSQPGYLITYAKMILVAASMNIYWFVLLIFYFLFSYIRSASISSTLATSLQLLLIIGFKGISAGIGYSRSQMAHRTMKGKKASTIFRIAILSEFEIDATCELYLSLVLPEIHNVTVFIGMQLIEIAYLAYVLLRDPRVSLLDKMPSCPVNTSEKPSTAVKSGDVREEKGDRRMRVLILQSQVFFMECVAKLFGSLTFLIMMPLMYYGPNKDWLSFTYDEDHLLMGMAYAGISVLLLSIILLMGYFYVKHKANTNLIARGLELLDDHMFQLMVCMYFFIPSFLTTHLGKQWNTLTYLDETFKH